MTETQIQAQIKMTAYLYMIDNGYDDAVAMYPEHAGFLLIAKEKTQEEVKAMLKPELYATAS